MENERIIFHVDVNNAFLSWTAVKLLEEGYKEDIRNIPSVIAGDESKRHRADDGCPCEGSRHWD